MQFINVCINDIKANSESISSSRLIKGQLDFEGLRIDLKDHIKNKT